ncbi:MAG: ABC transporter ATP-binding protein [Bacilli bacterium]|nr:ABC transporter ATP-binding protein [Bacilli bacterium]
MNKKIIEIKKLVKYYGKNKVLNSLSFDVNEGEILGLLGPNGSGKSTTINCLLSLLKFNSGSIKIFGEEMTPESYEIKRNIGVVFQNVAVFDELTVYENINYFCGLYINDKDLRKKYVMEAIELVGLNDFIKFYPKQLSGGLLRRLNIACGVSHKPKLIILDEPTVAVDPQSRNNILDGIKKLNSMGATIIYTTHYMEEVEQLCNRIIIIDKGNIIASGTKEEIKESIGIKEKVTVKVDGLSNEHIEKIIKMKNVEHVSYSDNNLYVEFSNGNHNLLNLLDYLKDNKYKCEKIFSELPTLNDVFLELTEKELRDNV